MAAYKNTSTRPDPLREHEFLCYRCLFRGNNHKCLTTVKSSNVDNTEVIRFTDPFAEASSTQFVQITSGYPQDQSSRRSRRSGGIFTKIPGALVSRLGSLSRERSDSIMSEDLWSASSRKSSVSSQSSYSGDESFIATMSSMTSLDANEFQFRTPTHMAPEDTTEDRPSFEDAYQALRDAIGVRPQRPDFRQEISRWSASTTESQIDDISSTYSEDSVCCSDEDEWSPCPLPASNDSFIYNPAIHEVEMRGFRNKAQHSSEPAGLPTIPFTRRPFRDTFGGH